MTVIPSEVEESYSAGNMGETVSACKRMRNAHPYKMDTAKSPPFAHPLGGCPVPAPPLEIERESDIIEARPVSWFVAKP